METNSRQKYHEQNIGKFKKYIWITITMWTLLILGFSSWNVHSHFNSEFGTAKNIAITHLEKDYVYRRWLSEQGGMYLPMSDKIQPNLYLKHVKEKNITSPAGKKLTLINPAYMTRLTQKFQEEKYNIKGHITSLNPIRLLNKADKWETKSLKKFHKEGIDNIVSIENINGIPHMRYMVAMKTEKGCLKCHGYQGYKTGDIRGGISVSIPWNPFEAKIFSQNKTSLSFHFIIWILGIMSLLTGSKRHEKNLLKLKNYDEELTESENQFRMVFENTNEAIIWVDWNKDKIMNCNSAFEKMFNTEMSSLAEKSFNKLLLKYKIKESDLVRLKTENNYEIETEIHGIGRSVKYAEISMITVHVNKNQINQYIIKDITERKNAEFEVEAQNQELAAQNEEFEVLTEELTTTNIDLYESEENLKKLVNEKDTLIKELYHRTKNTMQVIRGMLMLQADIYNDNVDIQKLVDITSQRIQAISLVHQMLYSSNDLSKISIQNYISKLTELIIQSFHQGECDKITLINDIQDCNFLLDTAIPFGLILNELMTNSFKYAFPENSKGKITIKLRIDPGNIVYFQYSDNGIGVPEDFDFRNQNSLGLDLIHSIGEEQMMGKIKMENFEGISCSIEFPANLYEERI